MTHVTQTLAQLTTLFHTPQRTVVFVSGGKDSLTLLHVLKPWRTEVTVLHLHEPDGWSDQTANLIQCMNDWGFLRSVQIMPQMSFEAYTQEYGWPVDLVPSAHDGATTRPLSPFYVEGSVKLASWWHCSIYRHLLPLQWAGEALKAERVFTGSRATDAPAFARYGDNWPRDTPWLRIDPLQHWTTAQVYAYIDANAIPLPAHYRVKRYDDSWEWHDCLSCCWQISHWRVLREHYPQEYAKRWPEVRPVFEALKKHTGDMQERLKELEDLAKA